MKVTKLRSRRRELRNFGLTMAAALAVLGLVALWRGRWFYPVLLVPAALLALLGGVSPAVLSPVQRGWMALAAGLGWVMTRLVLAALFYLAFTPIGLLGRLMGHRFLGSGIDTRKESYWIRRDRPVRPEEAGQEAMHYDRQF
jgi:hypothetical protein